MFFNVPYIYTILKIPNFVLVVSSFKHPSRSKNHFNVSKYTLQCHSFRTRFSLVDTVIWCDSNNGVIFFKCPIYTILKFSNFVLVVYYKTFTHPSRSKNHFHFSQYSLQHQAFLTRSKIGSIQDLSQNPTFLTTYSALIDLL